MNEQTTHPRLRDSQLELLRELGTLEGEATLAELRVRLGGRVDRNVEARLARLIDREQPLISYRYDGPRWSSRVVYFLTDKGREAIDD